MSETWIGEIEEKLDAANVTVAGIRTRLRQVNSLLFSDPNHAAIDALISELFARSPEIGIASAQIRDIKEALFASDSSLTKQEVELMKEQCAWSTAHMLNLQFDCHTIKNHLLEGTYNV